jgi:hypothetical protein
MFAIVSLAAPNSEEEVPPVVCCSACGRADCPGCESRVSEPPASVLPWEGPGPWWLRLWLTTEASARTPDIVFGTLRPAGVFRALAFSLLAETTALGSFVLGAVPAAWLVLPGTMAAWVADPTAYASALVSLLAASGLLVALHVLWGVSLEVGAKWAGSSFELRRGVRFGLYACGWDLVTSPAGFAVAVLRQGLGPSLALFGSAVRAPRTAMSVYLTECRSLDRAAARRARQVATWTAAMAVLGLAGAGLVLSLRWLLSAYGS